MTPLRTKDAILKLAPKQDLSGYAEKTEIPKNLSDFQEDENHRLVTDKEKEKWDKKSDKDTVTTINGKTGAITKEDIVALGIPSKDTNTTYSDATTSKSGLMSASDKKKLNGISNTNISTDLYVGLDPQNQTELMYTLIKIGDIVIFSMMTGYQWSQVSIPYNYRPKKRVVFWVISPEYPNDNQRVEIDTNGNINVLDGSASRDDLYFRPAAFTIAYKV